MVRRDLALRKLFRLDAVAQVDGLAAMVGHLNADGVFAGHALDENAFSAHGEAKIVVQAGDAAVLDASLGLELVGGDHGAGIDLDDLAADAELGAFLHQHAGLIAQLVLADGLRTVAGIEQRAGRQLEAADVFGRDGGVARAGIGAFVDGDLFRRLRLGGGNKDGTEGGRLEAADLDARVYIARSYGLGLYRRGLRGCRLLRNRIAAAKAFRRRVPKRWACESEEGLHLRLHPAGAERV